MMPTGGMSLKLADYASWVSILVLLDDAYRLQDRKAELELATSFNPCSSG